jgi:N,N-dimethylformamidase beta subunit-like protein
MNTLTRLLSIGGIAMLAAQARPAGSAQATPNPCASPANTIVAENCKPGNARTEWDINSSGDSTIQGFATDMSVNLGETISFKIDTDSPKYRIDIYRMGWYGGSGARLIETIRPSVALPQAQPDCLVLNQGRLVDCGNWKVSASWQAPANGVSGVYVARLVREDDAPAPWRSEGNDNPPATKPPAAPHSYGASGLGTLRDAMKEKRASHIVFVVRDDASRSDVLFQTADPTWVAYNRYGGSSLYGSWPVTGLGGGGGGGGGAAAATSIRQRAYKVSYNRPLSNRDGVANEQFFNAEYPLVRWLERNGYNISYSAGIDSHRRGDEIREHKIFVSAGHDAYWSREQRRGVEAARDGGVNLAFIGGSASMWKVRYEPSIDGSSTPNRTLVCYKESHADGKIDPQKAEWTGLWRDPRTFNPEGTKPESLLTGVVATVNGGLRNDRLQVPSRFAKLRFWRNTDIANLKDGEALYLGKGVLGHEFDEDLDNGARPGGLIQLSETIVDNVPYVQDYGTTYDSGTASHHLTLYRAGHGALVFSAGSVQYSWGLDNLHNHWMTGSFRVRPETAPPVKALQQATINLFADMGVQPTSLQPDLVPALQSTDGTSPVAKIESPERGVVVDGMVTIRGTAADRDGMVAGVEVSTDGGGSWHPALGTASWSYDWTVPRDLDRATILARAIDDSGNLETPGAGVNVRGHRGVTP